MKTFIGGTFIGNTFTGGTFQTDTTGQRVQIDSGDNIKFYAPDNTLVGSITAYNDGTVGDYIGVSGTIKAGEIRGSEIKVRDWSYLSENISTELGATRLRFNNTADWSLVSQIDLTAGEAIDNYEDVYRWNIYRKYVYRWYIPN